MTLKIEIYVPEDDVRGGAAGAYLQNAMTAIGFERPPSFTLPAFDQRTYSAAAVSEMVADVAEQVADAVDEKPVSATTSALALAAPPVTKRERGKPAPGRQRRTKEEMAEDEAADRADQQASAPQIRANPEARVGPEDEADAEQDAADEAAENEGDADVLTHDDARSALGRYVKAFGMDAAQEDGAKIIALVCGADAKKISQIPIDKIGAVVAGIDEAIAKNPFKRKAV